jgi:hypothetical protein
MLDFISTGNNGTIMSLVESPAGVVPAAEHSKFEQAQNHSFTDYQGEYTQWQ